MKKQTQATAKATQRSTANVMKKQQTNQSKTSRKVRNLEKEVHSLTEIGKIERDPRWSFGVENLSLGPLGIKGMKFNSRSDAGFSGSSTDLKKEQIIEMDEMITTFNGSTTFSNLVYSIQPGDPVTFPWLSKVSKLYERYKFESLLFYYKKSVSQFSVSGQQGKVIFSCDYDSISDPPDNAQVAESIDPHVDGLSSEDICLVLDPGRLSPSVGKFIRSGPVPGGADPKTYDAGSFYLSTYGQIDFAQLGELHVKYVVRLLNPRLPSTLPKLPKSYNYRLFQQNVALPVPSSVATNVLFPDSKPGSTSSLDMQNIAGVFHAPAGRYMVSWMLRAYCTSAAISNVIVQPFDASGTTTLEGEKSVESYSALQSVSQSGFFFWNNTFSNNTGVCGLQLNIAYSAGTCSAYGQIMFQAL